MLCAGERGSMKLSDLPPQEQGEIVSRRIEETRMLAHHAYTTMDPLALASMELDAQARFLGVHMEYQEELEDEEI